MRVRDGAVILCDFGGYSGQGVLFGFPSFAGCCRAADQVEMELGHILVATAVDKDGEGWEVEGNGRSQQPLINSQNNLLRFSIIQI